MRPFSGRITLRGGADGLGQRLGGPGRSRGPRRHVRRRRNTNLTSFHTPAYAGAARSACSSYPRLRRAGLTPQPLLVRRHRPAGHDAPVREPGHRVDQVDAQPDGRGRAAALRRAAGGALPGPRRAQGTARGARGQAPAGAWSPTHRRQPPRPRRRAGWPARTGTTGTRRLVRRTAARRGTHRRIPVQQSSYSLGATPVSHAPGTGSAAVDGLAHAISGAPIVVNTQPPPPLPTPPAPGRRSGADRAGERRHRTDCAA